MERNGERSSYLITKALKTFMWGSILASVSSQIATTTDAIVVSHLIGPDAMSAVNLVLPILTVFSALMILFGIGASVVAAKAIGRRDEEEANGIFSTCLIFSALTSCVLALVVYFATPVIISFLSSNNPRIYSFSVDYLQVMCYAVPFMMMSGVMENFVKTDGNPRIVMYAVIAGSLLNLVLDIIFIRFCNMGIEGSAWATTLNYIVVLLLCLIHFRSPHHSLKWKFVKEKVRLYLKETLQQGFSMAVNTILLALCVYVINSIILNEQGADGLYCWSVCLQVFMIMQMVLSGIGSSIFAIGGVLVGEQDMSGLKILNRKCLFYICGALAVLTAVILSTPRFFGMLFGGNNPEAALFLPMALRIFSILLIPYSIVVVLRSTYQILGKNSLSLFLSIAQLVVLVAFVWGFSFIDSEMLWWGFPVSAYLLCGCLLIYTFILHLKHHELDFGTLIPEIKQSESLNISVKNTLNDIEKAEEQVNTFLVLQRINEKVREKIMKACDMLMKNILAKQMKDSHKHYFDLHIRRNDREVNVLVKDDGKPYVPYNIVNPEDDSNRSPVKDEIESLATSTNYKYMYDQNMVLLSFALT